MTSETGEEAVYRGTAVLLNDRMIPFFDQHEVPLLRVLIDHGGKYCGNPEQHST